MTKISKSDPPIYIQGKFFWQQTLVTGSIALASTLFFATHWFFQNSWQYLAAAFLGILNLLAHVGGWLSIRFDKPKRRAIWIIAIMHVLTIGFAPLIFSDIWLIALIWLALVPFEIVLVDDLKRIPSALFLALLGAAITLLIDISSPFDRIYLTTEIPSALRLFLILLLIQSVVQIWIIWLLRSRDLRSHSLNVNLPTQLTIVFTSLAGGAILLVMIVLMIQIRQTQIEQVGYNFQTEAAVNSERVSNTINYQIDSLLSLGRQNAILQEGLYKSNLLHENAGEDALALLLNKNQVWKSSPDTGNFVLRIRNNPQSIELSKFRGVDLLHNNMLLIDRLGGLVAVQGDRPGDLFFGDQHWFLKAWNEGLGGIFIGDLDFSKNDKDPTILIAVGVLDPKTNQTVGVLASTYSISGIQHDLQIAEAGQDAKFFLVSSDGKVIASGDQQYVGASVWKKIIANDELRIINDENFQQKPTWHLGQDPQGSAAILAIAPLRTTTGVKADVFKELDWHVIVSNTQLEALASVTRSIKVAALVSAVLMMLIAAASAWLARILTRPIDSLTNAAVAASRGDLEQRADPVGPVELVSLAEAFNTLTAHLQRLIENLQEQVDERTEQLKIRADELTALNRVTEAVASALDLNTALNIVAREMVDLFMVKQTAIALLDKQRSKLTFVAEYNRDPKSGSIINLSFDVADSGISQQVLDDMRTLTVVQALENLQDEPIRQMLQKTRTFSLMVVPLLARGEVIGTIDITCDDRSRTFTQADVRLAETIAGQIAGAIDNARLFSEMQKAKEIAEAASAAKSDFLANVSHELRTPLTSVMGFARIVQKRLDEKVFPQLNHYDFRTQKTVDQIQQNLTIIVAEGERLTALINNVLDLSRIEAGKINWRKEPVDLIEVVEHAVAATAGLFENRNELKLIVELPEIIPFISGDRDRLIQVVINLISNAIKFTDHGTITCRVERLEKAILVSVADTGSGIPYSEQGRVFEKFIQLGDTLTEKPQGSGLGLPITKEIVETHGGQIWLKSQEGKGSTFFFTIPLQDELTELRKPDENMINAAY